jgi:hypothetical protein
MAAFMMTEVCTAVEVPNAVTGHRAGIYIYIYIYICRSLNNAEVSFCFHCQLYVFRIREELNRTKE